MPFHFYHSIEIRYGDLDPQGHVNNACYLTYCEQARVSYLMSLGLFGKDQSFLEIGIILADAQITFKRPALFGQDVRVGVRTVRLGNKSMDQEYELIDHADNAVLAAGRSVLVTYNYRDEKTIPIPAEWRRQIAEFEQIPFDEIR
jgi:acyl-CoA thioester hydrolase